ncbi:MAG: glycosyltransferase family 39 protein [Acidobacteria bacterium]|nr:MAG: glycosyltransferase family 39 protein [Acidobacteriota bacterium]
MSERWLAILFALAVAYLSLFYKLGNLAFIGADEPRYARIAEEMNDRQEYVTPTLEGRPWLEKPPLLFWLEAGSFKFFGVSEWSARLPVALCAVIAALATAFLATSVTGARAGFNAFLIVVTAPLFFVYGRAGSTDMPLVAALTLAVVAGFQASRVYSSEWALGAGASLGLAVLAKGPVALLLFAGIFLFYSLLIRSYPWTVRQTLVGSSTFLAVAVPWYWLVWLQNGADFVATFWLNHHLARFLTTIHHHSQPFWYYPPVLLIGFFPWVFFLFSSAARLFRYRGSVTGGHREEAFLWIWFLVPFVFFSSSNSKLAGYILPALPPLAGLVALEWERLLNGDVLASRWFKRELVLLFVLGLLVCLTLAIGFQRVYHAPGIGALLAAPLFLGLVGCFYHYRIHRPLGLYMVLVAALTLFAAFAFWLAAPVIDDYHSARDLSRLAGSSISAERPLILYRYFHHTALYYTGYRSTPEALLDREALRSYFGTHPQDRYLILTQESGWQDLRDGFPSRLIRHQGNLYLVEVVP